MVKLVILENRDEVKIEQLTKEERRIIRYEAERLILDIDTIKHCKNCEFIWTISNIPSTRKCPSCGLTL